MKSSMEVDYFSRMGSTHQICQDYCIAGTYKNRGYAILSDGCSGVQTPNMPGSPFTDFGSRFLVLAAQRCLQDFQDSFFHGERIIADAAAMARQVGLHKTSLDATLLVISQGDRYTKVFQTGDGVVAWRKRDGTINYTTRRYGQGAPYYLGYTLNFDRQLQYLEMAKTVTNIYGWQKPEGEWGRSEKEEPLPNDPVKGDSDHIFDPEDEDLVLILSDGVESFQKPNGDPVPLEEVLTHLFNIKGFKGQFLTRRCQNFLNRFCREQGWHHADDFSIAGIYLGE